jgi:hypothetical protein
MSGGVIEELLVALGVDADTAGVSDFADAIDMASAAMEIAAMAAAALTAVLVGAVAVTLEAAGAATEGAAKLGITTEQYQELAYAAAQAGVPMETLSEAMAKQTLLAQKAADGDEAAAAAFAALGVSVTDANGQMKSSAQIMAETADALAAIEDPTKRAAAASAIYGESAAKLLPLLGEGSGAMASMAAEARALGMVLSAEDVAAADTLGDSFDSLLGVVKGLAFAVGTTLVPYLQDAVDWVLDWTKANGQLVRDGIGALVTVLGTLVRILVSALDFVDRVVEATVGWETVLYAATAITVAWAAAVSVLLAAVTALVGVLAVALGGAVALAAALNPMTYIMGAVAAAVAGFVLVIEDLYTYLTGGDSLIGRFIDQWSQSEGVLGSVARLFQAMITLGQALWAALSPVGDALGGAFAAALPYVERLVSLVGGALMAGLNALIPVIDGITAGITAATELLGVEIPQAGAGAQTGAAAPMGAAMAGAMDAPATSTASLGVPAQAQGGGGSGRSVSVSGSTYNVSGLGLTEPQVTDLFRRLLDEQVRAIVEANEGAPA